MNFTRVDLFSSGLNLYMSWQLTLAIGGIGIWLIRKSLDQRISAKNILTLQIFTFVLTGLFPLAMLWKSPPRLQHSAPLKISFSNSQTPTSHLTALSPKDLTDPASLRQRIFLGNLDLRLESAMLATLTLLLLWGGLACLITLRQFLRGRRWLKNSTQLRKIGNVTILYSDLISMPAALAFGRKAFVILPSASLANLENIRVIVAHELQHHRQRDTLWIYVFSICKLFSFWNPFVHWLCAEISDQQELACDEALLSQKKVSPRVYAHLLLQMAETTLIGKKTFARAPEVGFFGRGQQFKRRIQLMFLPQRFSSNSPKAFLTMSFVSAIVITTLGFAANAGRNFVTDQRLNLVQAEQLTQKMQAESDFPMVMNESVLKWLNTYTATTEGRERMRQALLRKQDYDGMLQAKLREYGAPSELAAIPIVESGYKNSPQLPKSWSAGLWQFIASTAVKFGLKVNRDVDERVVPDLATDAAIRYLMANQLLFKDWHLAILGYNLGESAVRKAMIKTGYKTAWELVRNGYEGDPDYLPKFMAGLIVMKNPELITDP